MRPVAASALQSIRAVSEATEHYGQVMTNTARKLTIVRFADIPHACRWLTLNTKGRIGDARQKVQNFPAVVSRLFALAFSF